MRLDMLWQTGRKITSTFHCLVCVYSNRQDELLDVMAKLGSANLNSTVEIIALIVNLNYPSEIRPFCAVHTCSATTTQCP